MLLKIILSLLAILSFVEIHAQNREVEVTREADRKNTNTYILYSKNKTPGNKTIKIEFTTLLNMRVMGGGNPFIGKIGQGRNRLCSLVPRRNDQSVSFNYSYSYILGCKNSKHDKKAGYLLPFSEGKSIKPIIGTYDEEDRPKSFHKLFFKVEQGDTIFASRKGQFIDYYNEHSRFSYPEESGNQSDNYVYVQHDDCTTARYSGLGEMKLLVEYGDIVFPGQPIAIIGKKETTFFSFSVVYLDKNGPFFKNKKAKSKYNNAYVIPNFFRDNSIGILNDKSTYISQLDEKTITSEMSKKEKKKYKNKELY